jgi:hypothetical protein
LKARPDGGLFIAASSASADIRFFAGGITDGAEGNTNQLRMNIEGRPRGQRHDSASGGYDAKLPDSDVFFTSRPLRRMSAFAFATQRHKTLVLWCCVPQT